MAISLEGYIRSPDGLGDGTYAKLHPMSMRLELVRSLFEGDVLSIISTRKDADPQLHNARAIRLYDGTIKIFDGYIRAPSYDRGANKVRDLTLKAYNWDKELESIYITESGDYTNKSLDFILADLCRIANSAGVVKKAEYKYDPTKLPYYDETTFGATIPSIVLSGHIGPALKELTKLMDMMETDPFIGDWVIKVDSLQSDQYIYLIPQRVLTDSLVFGNFEVGAGFTDYFAHPYGLMLRAKTLEDITGSDLTITITYIDQGGASPNTATVTIPLGTPKDTYIPITLAPGDTLVKDVTNITGSGGGANNIVRIEGKGARVLPDWKLMPPKSIEKDYSKLLNHVVVKGSGGLLTQTKGSLPLLGTIGGMTASAGGSSILLIDPDATFQAWGVKEGDRVKNTTKSQTCSVISVDSQTQLTTTPLSATTWGDGDEYEMDIGELITSNNLYTNLTTQPATRSYLNITILNPTGSDKTGSVGLRGYTILPEEPDGTLEEAFYLRVPAGQAIDHATDNRYYSLLTYPSPNTGLHITGFTDCRIKVEEFMHGVAGRSINDLGLKADEFFNNNFTTQPQVNAYAKSLVCKYHAPLVNLLVEVKPDYQTSADITGKEVIIADDITRDNQYFVCLRQRLKWAGKAKHETLECIRYNTDWEYSEIL